MTEVLCLNIHKSAPKPIKTKSEIEAIYTQLFESILPLEKGIRLIGLSVSNFDSDVIAKDIGGQLRLEF